MLVFDPTKELRLLLAFFGESRKVQAERVAPENVPNPYHKLLVHDEHMTVTLEKHYGEPVRVKPYSVHRHGEIYGRKLDLLLTSCDDVVMTGIMLVNLSILDDDARTKVLAEVIPLGRILCEYTELRRITTGEFLKLPASEPMIQRFGSTSNRPSYGRLATIFLDEQPAVDLLEIVHPDLDQL